MRSGEEPKAMTGVVDQDCSMVWLTKSSLQESDGVKVVEVKA